MSNTDLLRILALTKQLFRLRIACELFRHFHEFTHAKTARLPGRCLDKSDCDCILGQYTLNASMAYCPHRQNLVSTDDDGHCMGDINVRMRKLLAMTNEKMS